MELVKNDVLMHGGRKISIISPLIINPNITAGYDKNGYCFIWANGSGYAALAELFAIAADLKRDEVLLLPARYAASEEFQQVFSGFEYNYNIVCTNYCETQISIKDAEKIIEAKSHAKNVINRFPAVSADYIERWKIDRRLTVKVHKRNMYISTNRDGFHSLARGASDMSEYGDQYMDGFLPHRHFDWDENTSASLGVTLYYWQDKVQDL